MKKQFLKIFFTMALLVLTSISGIPAFSQTWTGNTSSDWNDPANWTGGVPANNADVIITNGTFKPVINTNITLGQVQVGSWYPGPGATYIDVVDGGTLTITEKLTFISDGYLLINGGDVELTYTNPTSTTTGNNQNYIEMTGGSFTTAGDFIVNTNSPGFLIGDGDAVINGHFIVNSGKVVEIENGTLEVGGFLEVHSDANFHTNSGELTVLGVGGFDTDITRTKLLGNFYGNDGITSFHGETEIGSGGRFYLETGSVDFHEFTTLGNNGIAYLGSGTVNVHDNIDIISGGYLHIENATLNVTGNATFTNNGNLTINSGSLNVGGDATLNSGGILDLNSGSLTVGGNAEFTSGGTVNAGDATITLEGDITIQNDSNFNPDSSTVVFSGDENQTIHVDDGDINFYNVVVDSGSVFQSDGVSENTIVIENDLTVNDGGTVVIQDDDQIDIQGSLDDESESVVIDRPFIRFLTTPNLTTAKIEFDKDMQTASVENISNYSMNHGISILDAVHDVNNPRIVWLTVTPMTEDVEYELTVSNVFATNGEEIISGHIKRFSADTIVSFYSRKNGDWSSNSAWSTTGFNGSAASQNPTNTVNATIAIDSSHTIMVTSSASIIGQASVSVNNGKLLVTDTGILELGEKVITGSGTFEVTTGTLKIGHEEGISNSGTTGNIQTATRIYSSNATYAYNGSSAQFSGNGLPTEVSELHVENPVSVRLESNLQVNDTLKLLNGSLIIPSGKNLIANTKAITNGNLTAEQLISGNIGWRMLASPLSSTFGDMLDNTVTQGYSGAFYSTGTNPGDTLQPNVLFYEESYPGTDNQRWRAPAHANSSLSAGQGFYTFIFGDVPGDPLYNLELPQTLSVSGQENEGDGTKVDFNVTYTTEADSGWNLVGNPFAATIDWDNEAEWVKNNIDNTIYIWDSVSKSYKTWNGVTGDLENGLISPFQGFWVKANNEDPELQVNKSAKTFGAEFVGKQIQKPDEVPVISLRLSDGKNESTAHLMFSEAAKTGKDPYDAYKLVPPGEVSSFVHISSVTEGNQFAINNLPRRFGMAIEIPVYTHAFEKGVSATKDLEISWEQTNLPAGWLVEIVDLETRAKVAAEYNSSYSFTQKGSSVILAPNLSAGGRPKSTTYSSGKKPRFMIKIHPGADGFDLPDSYSLEQNYPNPFNPVTKIQFSLPLQGKAELTIYDMLGRKIANLVDDELPAGTHTYTWNASGMASGIYLYRLITSGAVVTKKMTLIK